ncbi:MAG: hypothetical protein A2015_00905 [Spirochaetes bacterium GWF1_31_7]|nr:MAG: hypothetical protein A2Y30_12765 [Spirochaetes bacterium GWE1_32_154]OHD51678.1 MAG: hypothetical protein A2Y29_04565 [Spirochaetes bacterium GWE2_31_10]OHD51930.1 MAG: hypothetical protein A2015_00905 [Spirochaetes bacterium GWF1_31_7]HBD93015.1 hypothetical protein [Spirochaetia bacterium]
MIFTRATLYYDLKVFQDVYQLILKVFEFTKDFPREYKFTFGQDMKRDAIVLVRSICRANKAVKKTEYLKCVEPELDAFRYSGQEKPFPFGIKIVQSPDMSRMMDFIRKFRVVFLL